MKNNLISLEKTPSGNKPADQSHSDRLISFLMEKDLINEQALHICMEERKVTDMDLGIILVRNGFIRQSDLTAAIIESSPEMLYDDTVMIPSIPAQELINLKAVMVAETPTRIYASTLSSEVEVTDMIAKYDIRPVEFVPLNMDKLDEYMDYLSRHISSDEDSLVDRIIRSALNQGISDLHIMPRQNSYTIFQRRLGVREWAHEGSQDEYSVLVARIKDRSKMDLSERRRPQDGSFQTEHLKRMVDLRVSTSPTVHGEYVVIRLLDPDAIQPNLTSLGITRVGDWRDGVSRANGLCLICGPTGSGKTTTLNSTLREIDRIEKAVFTIEDPVEYTTPFVGQVNTNNAVGLDFSRGLKAFMRQDPDIIITGEIRDEETARISIKGAETGHNMIATLHTNTVRGAVDRLRDLGVAHYELRYILRTILVQRLIRVYCKHCHGEGCLACGDSGYGGRTIVSECAYFPDEESVDRMLKGEVWWPTMVQDAVGKYIAGETSRDEIIRTFRAEGIKALEEAGV